MPSQNRENTRKKIAQIVCEVTAVATAPSKPNKVKTFGEILRRVQTRPNR
jgi:hypothetical protein